MRYPGVEHMTSNSLFVTITLAASQSLNLSKFQRDLAVHQNIFPDLKNLILTNLYKERTIYLNIEKISLGFILLKVWINSCFAVFLPFFNTASKFRTYMKTLNLLSILEKSK